VNPDRRRWNEKHARGGRDLPSIPLLRYQGRLKPGRALDVACGFGENAALLALAGWRVLAFDLSDVAVARTRARASELRTRVGVVQADAARLPFRGPFDTIVVTRFLDRRGLPGLAALLSPGGTIFCEHPLVGLKPEYLVAPGELRNLLPDLEPLVDEADGFTAIFLGRRRPPRRLNPIVLCT
jgi:SAM-dependent methyltransferase